MMMPFTGMMGPMASSFKRGIQYLLRDEFTTAQSAPLTSPRSCEPVGTLTITDTINNLSIVSGRLRSSVGIGAFTDPRVVGGAITRSAGKAILGSLYYTGSQIILGWMSATAGGLVNCIDVMYVLSASDTRFFNGAGASYSTAYSTSITGVEFQFAIILRASGSYLFVRAGNTGNWTLIWVNNTTTTATLYPTICRATAAGQLEVDNFRVLDISTLDARFASDYALATTRLAASVSALTPFTHEANFILEWTQTSIGPSGATRIQFRRVDSLNTWMLNVTATGDLFLFEVVAGSAFNRGSVNAIVTAGHRILLVADGTTIRVYSNNVLRITYTSAVNFQNVTTGLVEQISTGHAISNLISYPRSITFAKEF